MRLAFSFSYLGDNFYGSQMQPDLRTVEGEFIAACRRLLLFEDWRTAGFATAGRTDRGVHAKMQVCAFSTDHPERAKTALNLLLPRDIWCTGWAAVPDTFHPRYDAQSRTYRYFFSEVLDIEAMQRAAPFFIGEHDFSSFVRPDERNPVRNVLSASIYSDGGRIVFEVTAESFLWNMVRGMASALHRVGCGTATAGDISGMLENPGGNRITPALPEGLILWRVGYPFPFDPLQQDTRSRSFLTGLKRHHALMERVVSALGDL